MTSVIARAKAHFSAIPRRHEDVPEWGDPGKPLRIFFGPLTVGQRNRIYARDINGVEPPLGTVCVRTLLEMATDEAGAKIFNAFSDEEELTHGVDSAVVARVAINILGAMPRTADERDDQAAATKNG